MSQVRSTELIPLCLTPTWQARSLYKKGKTKITEWTLIRNNIIATAMFTHGEPLMNRFTSYKEGSNLTLTLGSSWMGKEWKHSPFPLHPQGQSTFAGQSAWPCCRGVYLLNSGLKHPSWQRMPPHLLQLSWPDLPSTSYAVDFQSVAPTADFNFSLKCIKRIWGII